MKLEKFFCPAHIWQIVSYQSLGNLEKIPNRFRRAKLDRIENLEVVLRGSLLKEIVGLCQLIESRLSGAIEFTNSRASQTALPLKPRSTK